MSERATRDHRIDDRARLRQARIMIVDDEPLSCQLLAGILRKQGFDRLLVAECGRQALERLREFQPDLVLLDMQMPDLNGLEVCERIRAYAEFVDVPILIQTATVNPKEMGELFAAGGSDFLSKPINPAELIARVFVHLERRVLLGEMRDYRERISSELEAARRMQFEMLPSPIMQQKVAGASGLRIGSYNRSSSEIGGDLWGILPIDHRSFGIFLADFTGHGVTSALNTFRLHALIHEYKALHGEPGQLVETLNERLSKLLPTGQFATFLYVVIDHASEALRMCSAGAPPLVVKNGLHERARLIQASGVPLGIVSGVQYQEHRCAFGADSLLILYSDGLPEFPNPDGERLGEEALATKLDRLHPGMGPHEIIDELCRAAGIAAGQLLPDDTTIVCVDRRVGSLARSCQDCYFNQETQPGRAAERALCHAGEDKVAAC